MNKDANPPIPTAEQQRMLDRTIEAAIPEIRQALIMVLSRRAACDHFTIAKFSNKTPGFNGAIRCFIAEETIALILDGTSEGIERAWRR